jgi:hypothetical protein
MWSFMLVDIVHLYEKNSWIFLDVYVRCNQQNPAYLFDIARELQARHYSILQEITTCVTQVQQPKKFLGSLLWTLDKTA